MTFCLNSLVLLRSGAASYGYTYGCGLWKYLDRWFCLFAALYCVVWCGVVWCGVVWCSIGSCEDVLVQMGFPGALGSVSCAAGYWLAAYATGLMS